MKRWVSVALIVIGVAILLAARINVDVQMQRIDITPIAITIAGVLLVTAVIGWVTRLDHRSAAAFRFDWFLPQIRRCKPGQSSSTRWLGRFGRRISPSWLVSDYATKRRGAVRKALRKLGVSWLASPVRRVVQTVCLVLFLGSFFYVCWPYTAAPSPPARQSAGWRFMGIDQQSGAVDLFHDDPAGWLADANNVYLQSDAGGTAARVQVVARGGGSITLLADADFPDQTFDELLTGGGTWTILDKAPDAWPSHYADDLAAKERFPAELFLTIDPLVSLSTAIASRSWVWSLVCAAVILIVCVLIPRGFCGYLCPLGTTIDLFDWAVGSRTERFRVAADGWWVHIKYYLLAGTLVAAACGILLSGFVSAIPVITRAALFIGEPLQSGTLRGWHLVPAAGWGQAISIVLFAAVLALGFLRPRFWCKYVCPSGAVFSLGNLFRVTERKVESSCIHCNKCVEICPFDAIKPDFTTRTSDCTLCQSCGGVCPTHAIKFVERWNVVELKVQDDPPTGETPIGRRGFMSLAAGSAAAVVGGATLAGATRLSGANLADDDSPRPVRPPGSVPEQQFLQMCIRCGECFKACPNNVLQPESFQQGLEGLWAPMVVADWAGCESSCNACGQVCPTGAIRPLTLEEKKVARMGLAIVNDKTCLPMAGREDCDLCVQECIAAGYDAIEYIQVGTEIDEDGVPIEGSGMLAPVVLNDKCVGCGLCQTRCYAINVKDRGVLTQSAIVIEAGEGKEDRLMSGSYLELRRKEQDTPRTTTPGENQRGFDQPVPAPTEESASDNPFGL